MTSNDPSHLSLIAEALGDLGQGPALYPDEYRLLAGGLSGSSVYAIHLADERVVLKVTLPTSTPALLVQAGREASFYQRLAQDVPIAVPRLVATSTSKASGVAILLGACEPTPPLTAWTNRDYTDIAAQLGLLHGRFWGKADRLRTFRWLRPAPPTAPSIRYRRAMSAWRVMSERKELDDGMTPRRLQAVPDLMARLSGLDPPPSLSETLLHGDCHPDNLLQSEAREWIWADWQAVRTGQGPTDLVFFWQRAEMAGGKIPRESMVSAYRTGLVVDGAETPTPDRLELALAWAEFTSWLLDWPPYLAGVSASRLGSVLDRMDDLIERLEINRAD